MTMADVWPALPMQIWNNLGLTWLPCSVETDNIVAALKYHDRVSHVDLQGLPNRTLESLAAEMDEMNALSIGEPEFYDLKQPWLYSRHQ